MVQRMTIKLAMLLGVLSLALLPTIPVAAQDDPFGIGTLLEHFFEDHHDISPPLRHIPPALQRGGPDHVIPLRYPHPSRSSSQKPDPALQTSSTSKISISGGISLPGIGVGFKGPNGTFIPDAAPPDTNGAVGATQYVQWVNESFAVFDKATGAVTYGPVPGNTLWTGFGGGCEQNNDGDPIAQYDKAANRWVMTQFSVSTTPYLQCVAVSQTSDATGNWYRYAFQMPNFPDYPKLGIWPDGYYISFNMFSGNFFSGARVCALNRNSMLTGSTASAQCFQLSSSYASLLPSDVDGFTPPPSGSPNYLLNFGTNSLRLWKFHVDWVNPNNSTLTGPTTISVKAFYPACGGRSCIPQKGTSQKLDSLGDRLMYRLAYRNFGDHESLVVTHSVSAVLGSTTGNTGIRWYELRNPGGTSTVYQQATFAPDSNYRWMGSIAMDKTGDIAVGYSVSGSTTYPAIRYTGRLSTDALNTLQTEATIIQGSGSQTQGLNRWGDYSSMSIDPVDDCTFWYTNQYQASNGSFNWSTRIFSFKFPSCL